LLQRLNINAVPYGATYHENQNPQSFFSGGVISNYAVRLWLHLCKQAETSAEAPLDNFLRPTRLWQHQPPSDGRHGKLHCCKRKSTAASARDLFWSQLLRSRNMTTVEAMVPLSGHTRRANLCSGGFASSP